MSTLVIPEGDTLLELSPEVQSVVAPQLSDNLIAELVDRKGCTPEWARKRVPGNFLRDGGSVKFTLEAPTKQFKSKWFDIRDGEMILLRKRCVITLRLSPDGADSLQINWTGLVP